MSAGAGDAMREEVAEAVAGLDPVDARESASVVEVLRALRDMPAPFDRDADPTHLTGSALLVGSRGIVLLRHKRLGIWLQPGGHIDAGEWPWEAAAREAEEETGLTVRHPPRGPLLCHVDAHDAGAGHHHLDLRYLLTADPEDPTPPPEESQECRWFGWEEATAIADAGLRGALPTARALAGVAFG